MGKSDTKNENPSCSLMEHTSSFQSLKRDTLARLTTLSHHISPLSPDDEVFFRALFRQESVCYSNSWLYLLRSTRNEGEWGYKYKNPHMIMGIGYRHHTLYFVHPIGHGRTQIILDLCDKVIQSTGCSVVLKKADEELSEALLSTRRFREGTRGEALLEEEAYPEHMLHLKRLYSPHTGLYHQSLPFMRKVRRFARGAMTLQARTDLVDVENAPGFPRLFGGNPDKYNSYKQMIREVCSCRTRRDLYSIAGYYDERAVIHGLYIAERLSEDAMGLYCAVSSRSEPGMTEWMDHDFFQRLYQEGITYLYLGGSETAGVDGYVQKLLPAVPSYNVRPLVIGDWHRG